MTALLNSDLLKYPQIGAILQEGNIHIKIRYKHVLKYG